MLSNSWFRLLHQGRTTLLEGKISLTLEVLRPSGAQLLSCGASGRLWALLDFVLHALWALRPCDPRLHPSASHHFFFNFFSSFFFIFFFISASKYYFDDDDDDLVVESNAAVRI